MLVYDFLNTFNILCFKIGVSVSNSFTVFEMWSETNILILKDKIQDLFSFSKLRFSKIARVTNVFKVQA